MGKKRRIMTSGQKFVKKYRSWMEKAGDSAAGGDGAINVPDMDPFISEAEITPHGNGEVSFRCFIENLSGADDDLKLKLDGVALFDAPIADSATAENITINGKNPSGKTAAGMPAPVVPLGNLTDVTISNALLTAAQGQLVVSPGKHTLEVAVSKGGNTTPKKSLTKRIKFTAPTPKVDLSKISAVWDGTGEDALLELKVAGNVDTALNVTTAAGSCSGERGFTIGAAADKNKVEVLFFSGPDDQAIAAPGDTAPAANAASIGAIHGIKTGALSLIAGTQVKIKITAVKAQAVGAAAEGGKNEASTRTLIYTVPAAE